MDGNIVSFANVLRDICKPDTSQHIQELHLALAGALKSKLGIQLNLESYQQVSTTRIISTFKSPMDGNTYRLILEPVEKKGAAA